MKLLMIFLIENGKNCLWTSSFPIPLECSTSFGTALSCDMKEVEFVENWRWIMEIKAIKINFHITWILIYHSFSLILNRIKINCNASVFSLIYYSLHLRLQNSLVPYNYACFQIVPTIIYCANTTYL